MSKIEKWKALALQLKAVKEEELQLRKELAAEVIANTEMKNGMVTVREVVDGYPCKAVQALNHRLDLGVLGSIWENLTEVEKAVVKMKPTLQTGPYKKLPEDSLLHEAVVSSLATPTLEVGDYVG